MKRFDQINVIPFIDIMLVLLAIVLTTATFISQGSIEVDLPQAESAEALPQADEKTVEIAIDTEKRLFFEGDAITQLELAVKLENLAKETPVILRVDKRVAFQNFVSVVDLLKKNKLEKLSILTSEANEK